MDQHVITYLQTYLRAGTYVKIEKTFKDGSSDWWWKHCHSLKLDPVKTWVNHARHHTTAFIQGL
jgi:hypothetical protein